MSIGTVTIGHQSTRVRLPDDPQGLARHPDYDYSLPDVPSLGQIAAAQRRVAIAVGVRKLFGKSAFWWPDHGLPGYGQVCKPTNTPNCNNCVTPRVRLEVR